MIPDVPCLAVEDDAAVEPLHECARQVGHEPAPHECLCGHEWS